MQKKHFTNSIVSFHSKKSLNKLGVEGNYLNIIKATNEKPMTNIFNGKKAKFFL